MSETTTAEILLLMLYQPFVRLSSVKLTIAASLTKMPTFTRFLSDSDFAKAAVVICGGVLPLSVRLNAPKPANA